MKLTNYFRILVMLFFLFSSVFYLSAETESSECIDIGDWLEYDVIESSNTTNVFFGAFPPGINYGNWSIVNGEKIKFDIMSTTYNHINCSLTLGNYSFQNIRNIDASTALALSIYPWNGGFIANASDWSNIELQIQNTNTTTSSFDKFEHIINNTSGYYQTRVFNTTNYYGQNSLFFYHHESGILLKASTSFGLYKLNISLIKSSIEIENQNETIAYDYPAFISLASIIVIAVTLRISLHRRRNCYL